MTCDEQETAGTPWTAHLGLNESSKSFVCDKIWSALYVECVCCHVPMFGVCIRDGE